MMQWLKESFCRLVAAFRSGSLDKQMETELQFHLDMETEAGIRRGLGYNDAKRAAHLRIGQLPSTRETIRERRGFASLDRFFQDLRYAARTFRQNITLTTTIAATLTLGIGANTAIFTLFDAILLRSLPVTRPEELVIVKPIQSNGTAIISYPVFEEMQARQHALTALLATSGIERMTVHFEDSKEPVRVMGNLVSGNYFSVLGAPIAVGRAFTALDEKSQAPRLAVISNALWHRRFGADPAIIDRTLYVNGVPATIIGVSSREFRGDTPGLSPDLWVLLTQFRASDLLNRAGTFFAVMGRLRPGVRLETAQAELTLLYQQSMAAELNESSSTAASHRSRAKDYRIQLENGGRGFLFLQRQFAKPLVLAMVIVGLVLLIACANIANLLLSRAAARQKEISIRLALGCSRARLIRQLLTESLLLAILGTIGGVLLAYATGRLLTGLLAGGLLPITLELKPDGFVFLFVAALSLFTSIAFGLAPALRASATSIGANLGSQAQIHTRTKPRQRLAKVLVSGQVAVSVLLLVTAGLLISSLRSIAEIDPGFDREHVLLVEVHADRTPTADQITSFDRQLTEIMKALPGIRSVSCSWIPLFDPFTDLSAPLAIEGYTRRASEIPLARYNTASAEYFRTVGMRIIAGREFTPDDRQNSPPVVIVNETFAKTYFAGRSALGKFITIAVGPKNSWVPREIVGVAKDAKYRDLRRETKPLFYVPNTQIVRPIQSIEIRTAGSANPIALGESVRRALHQVAPGFIVDSIRSMAQQVDRPIAQERFIAKVAGSFGFLALLLAIVGLYGLITYAVARRTSEVGVRIALGASRADILLMIIRESLSFVAIGAVCGLLLAFAATRLVSGFLYGLRATDPKVFIAATLLLLSASALAAYLPALRASRVDPVQALRYE